MTKYFNLDVAHPSWHSCLKAALTQVDQAYLQELYQTDDWLPGHDKIFSAFSLPLTEIKFILLGESPYPRKQSANGYAFWDHAVKELWCEKGMSKTVNRATSLRNIIKMLLVAENLLHPEKTTQDEIAKIDKCDLVQTNEEFFNCLLRQGFLLLNATLVLRTKDIKPSNVKKDAAAWQPFIEYILNFILEKNPSAKLILFGQIANLINKIPHLEKLPKLFAEHPYNLSFINNKDVIDFFKPLHLLKKNQNV